MICLKSQLKKIHDEYHLEKSPQHVFEIFLKHYPTYYEGNKESLNDVLERIRDNNVNWDEDKIEVW